MSEQSSVSQADQKQETSQRRNSELFAALVAQLSHLALVALGRVSLQNGAKPAVDLEMSQFYIDTLEMLEAKTRGNLSPTEHEMLQRELMALRMCFVEAVESGVTARSQPETVPTGGSQEEQPKSAEKPVADEPRKRFVKKYGSAEDSAPASK